MNWNWRSLTCSRTSLLPVKPITSRITAQTFPVDQNLSVNSLEANQATIDNIRLG